MVELIEFRAKKFDDKLPLLQSKEESEQLCAIAKQLLGF